MQRYAELITYKENRKQIYETIYYPEIEISDDDIYIISKRLDRLDILAYEHYNDQTLWFVIAEANNLGKGTLIIPPGTRIRIPDPSKIYEIQTLIKDANY